MKTPSREAAWKPSDARAAETAKTARLRGLRLAKEAADRDAAQIAAAAAVKLKPASRARGSVRAGRSHEAG